MKFATLEEKRKTHNGLMYLKLSKKEQANIFDKKRKLTEVYKKLKIYGMYWQVCSKTKTT